MWLVIQHVAYDGRGGIAPALRRAGLDAVDCRPFRGEQLPAASDVSGLIVLGAPEGAADAERPAHLVAERRLIAQAVHRGIPVLGVCFGAQLLAAALGANIVKDGPLEVGMGSVTLTDAGLSDPVLGTARGEVPVLHWHRHGYTLPSRAVRLATGDRHSEQAFRIGERAYGLQFHVEINPALAGVIADGLPAGSLPAEAVAEADSWGGALLDRFLALG